MAKWTAATHTVTAPTSAESELTHKAALSLMSEYDEGLCHGPLSAGPPHTLLHCSGLWTLNLV